MSDTPEIGRDTRECSAMFPECVMIRALAFKRRDDPAGLSDTFAPVFPHALNPFINLSYLFSLMCVKGTWEESTFLRAKKLIPSKSDISGKTVAYLRHGEHTSIFSGH